jgi:hypothetical protein
MNVINPTSREFLCQHINGSTFAADLTNVTSYYQINSIEKSKLIEIVEVSTISEASITEQFTALTSGTTVKMTHPFNTWNAEGFVVGATIRVEANGNSTNGTITSIVGTDMYFTDATFIADLSVTDGNARADYVVKSTTVPTTLIWKYGVIPNDQANPTYVSPLTGNPLVYAGGGITGALTDIPFTGAIRDDMGTVECKYNGASGTGNYIFEFEIEHTFQNFFYLADWFANYQANTVPPEYLGVNSFKYVCEMTFGTNINNTNETKTFADAYQIGSTGLNDQNFNAGEVNYTLESIAYADGATTLTKINADVSTDVTIQIKKNNGNWTAGERAYLYHSKLPSNSEYTAAADSVTTFEELFVFKSHSNTDGAGASTNGFIVNLLVAIDGVDPTLLNITFTLTYAADQLARITQGDNYFLGVGVEDSPSTTAITSDRVIVWCDQLTWDKSADITGLITVPQMNFYNATEDLAIATPTSNANTWINTIHLLTGNFRLTKFPDSDDGILVSLDIKEMAYYVAESKQFTIQSFSFPIGGQKTGPALIDVGGTGYQPVNYNTTRVLGNIPSTDNRSKVQINSIIPAVYQNYQVFSWQLGWVFGWREWVANQNVEDVAPEFYDSTADNNNFNERTSNYSGINNYDIYMFATAVVRRNNVLTIYNLISDKCSISDFDYDKVTTGWALQSFKIYDENNEETDNLFTGQDMKIVVIIDNPGALLNLANTGGEIVCEVSGSNGVHSRLHTVRDWETDANLLKPQVGSTHCDISQVAGAPNEVHLTCLIKGEKLNEANDYNFYGHLDSL